jgi:adenylate cyclase
LWPTPGSRWHRIVPAAVVGLLAAALGMAALYGPVLRGQEGQTVDLRFSLRGTHPPDPRLALISAGEPDFQKTGWPIPLGLHAKLIDDLRRDGARVIAYDFDFSEASNRGRAALVLAARAARNVVFASFATNSLGQGDALWRNALALKYARATTGDVAFPVDADGVVRRLPYEANGLVSFASAIARRAGTPVGPFDGNRSWVDFAGAGGTYPNYSFEDVLHGKVPASAFRGRVVIVGDTSPLDHDQHATPVDPVMPGSELEANAVATLLAGRPLRSSAPWVGILLVLALAGVIPALGLAVRPVWLLLAALTLAAASLASDQFAFDRGVVVPAVAPLLALSVAGASTISLGFLEQARARERTREVFRRFVGGDVVDDVLARAGEELKLGGKSIEATVMFSDLRGFTNFSQARDAADVIEILNLYLGQMTEAILGHGGTLVAFMGDGIFAVFGAPIESDDHADRALAACREMLQVRLPRVNGWLAERGLDAEFRMGIGLNSGRVMSGTVGSEQRLEYAAIGDTTNTASRIEGMTKTAGVPLLFSESTRVLLSEPVEGLVEVGEQEIRGKDEPVLLWTVRIPEPQPEPEAEPEAPPAGSAVPA